MTSPQFSIAAIRPEKIKHKNEREQQQQKIYKLNLRTEDRYESGRMKQIDLISFFTRLKLYFTMAQNISTSHSQT